MQTMNNSRNLNPIGTVHSLGGCGGTLLAQCLGCMQNTLVLSECNPLSANLYEQNLNPYVQIQKWNQELFLKIKDFVTAKELANEKKFCEFTQEINFHLTQMGIRLVIRDYNYIDYFGIPYIEKPAMKSSLMQSIRDIGIINQVILARHPLDQYKSLRSHEILKDLLTPDIFLNGYIAFLSDFSNIKIIKYENLLANPGETIADLSDYFNLTFYKNFIDSFYKNTSVTGNFKRIQETKILPSQQAYGSDQWCDNLQNHSLYKEVLIKLGY